MVKSWITLIRWLGCWVELSIQEYYISQYIKLSVIFILTQRPKHLVGEPMVHHSWGNLPLYQSLKHDCYQVLEGIVIRVLLRHKLQMFKQFAYSGNSQVSFFSLQVCIIFQIRKGFNFRVFCTYHFQMVGQDLPFLGLLM